MFFLFKCKNIEVGVILMPFVEVKIPMKDDAKENKLKTKKNVQKKKIGRNGYFRKSR